MWPTGMPAVGVDLKGRIPAGEQAATGRALGRLSDIGWGTRLRALLALDAPDAPVPAPVLDAVVTLLADWSRGPSAWEQRPAGIVSVASRTRPELIGSLAAGIARIGRLPLLGQVEYAPGADPRRGARGNSAQRLKQLHGALTVPDLLAAGLAELGGSNAGPVLLVDDYADSGWTLAVATRLLRRAGAPGVLPLVLAQSA
jgi:ATP-dependent DNA helicase RecQ